MGLLLVFIVDVSESMGAQVEPSAGGGYGAGLTALDLAKAAVEQMVKPRKAKLCDARPEFRDRHFLLTTEEGPGSIRASWNDDPSKFQEQLKMLAPVKGKPTSLAGALSTAFAILNQFRMQYGVDNYGQGRLPWRLEPGACILLTDGESLQPEGKGLTLTCPNTLGAELTREPYRWDQRLFSLVMQGSGSSGGPGPTSILRTLTESTGGWYSVSHSYTTLSVSAKFVAHKLNIIGPVVILAPDPFEQANAPPLSSGQGGGPPSTPQQQQQQVASISPTTTSPPANGAAGAQQQQQQQPQPPQPPGGSPLQPPPPSSQLPSSAQQSQSSSSSSASSSHVPHPAGVRAVMCLRGSNTGATATWPIPESFWLERSMDLLPRRDAQPTLFYRRLSADSNDPALTCLELVDRLGIVSDCYDLDWSGPPLKMSRAARWPVYVWDSSRTKGRGEPIGYLQAGAVVGRAVLVLLPYNYPRLVPLIKQAVDAGSAQGNLTNLPVKWRPDFNQYLGSLPPYYFAPLKRALRKLGVASQVQEVKGGGLSQVTMRRLQRYGEMAQEEYQRLDAIVNRDDGHWRRPSIDNSGSSGKGGADAQHHHQAGPWPEGLDLSGLDLIPAWESTRRRLFGEGGLTVMGLHIRGVEGRNGVCSSSSSSSSKNNMARACLLTEAGVGAALMPSRPVMDMGYYHQKLARTELPRDPMSDPEPDEDSLEGIMRRRLNVDFGNPFHPQSHSGGGLRGTTSNNNTLSGPRLVVDEAADEARVLSPQLVTGDDLNNGLAGDDDAAASYESGEGMDGSSDMDIGGEGGQGSGGSSSSSSQPSKKRQRLTELPSLPIHKKIRRHGGLPHHRQHQPPPDLSSVPLAAAVVHVNVNVEGFIPSPGTITGTTTTSSNLPPVSRPDQQQPPPGFSAPLPANNKPPTFLPPPPVVIDQPPSPPAASVLPPAPVPAPLPAAGPSPATVQLEEGEEVEEEEEVEEGEEPEQPHLRIVAPPSGGAPLVPASNLPSPPTSLYGSHPSQLRSPRDAPLPVPHSPRPSPLTPPPQPLQTQRPPSVAYPSSSMGEDQSGGGGGPLGAAGGLPPPPPRSSRRPPAAAGGGGISPVAVVGGQQPIMPLQQQPPPPHQQQPSQASPVSPSSAACSSVSPNLMRPNKDGWMPAFSKRENRPYYYNITSRQSVWGTPPGCLPLEQIYKEFFAQQPPAPPSQPGGGGGGAV